MSYKNSEIRKHWDLVARIGCIVTRTEPVTLHHTHGGSMTLVGVHRGMGQKTSGWLVIPICWNLHVGDLGIDRMGVVAWEKKFGTQVEHLDEVCRRLGYNVWFRAGVQREV